MPASLTYFSTSRSVRNPVSKIKVSSDRRTRAEVTMRLYVSTHMNTHVYPYNMNTYTHSSKELVDEVLNFSNIKK